MWFMDAHANCMYEQYDNNRPEMVIEWCDQNVILSNRIVLIILINTRMAF